MPTRSAQANQNTELSETPPEVFMQVPYRVALDQQVYGCDD